MPTTIAKNLNLCFTKIQQPSSPQHDHNRPSTLIKNFNSLYDFTLDSTITPHHSFSSNSADPDLKTAFASHRFFCSAPGVSSSIIDSSPRALTTSSPPSKRTTGEMTYCNGTKTEEEIRGNNVVGGRIAISTFSPDPYVDFRRSMQEMVEARELKDVRANWDDLHELLMCFLALNPKCSHKFIFGAFADLLVSLMESFPDEHDFRNLSYFRSDRLL